MNRSEHADGSERSIPHQPALDGVRAVAVGLVLLFHLGVSWMSGGYLGVSVFFTLSGFLITTLLLTELAKSGTISLRRFYGRRARRLLPATLVCLAGVCVLIALDLTPDRSGLRWYVFGALFQFANWVPLGLSDSYAELFNALSPTDHFWSLAIEEQFYWLWPLSMLALYALARRGIEAVDRAVWQARLQRLLVALFAVFAISAPLTAIWWSKDAAYFATWARVPEILAGAVLAVVCTRGVLPHWTRWLGAPALAAIIVLSIVTPAGNGLAYDGFLPLFALVSAALIAGLQHAGPVRTLLATAPFEFVGRISYGLYLYHWPVFVVLTEARTGWSVWALSMLRLAVTFAIAVASFFLIEQPIRTRRLFATPRHALTALAVAVPVVVLLVVTNVANTSSFAAPSSTLPPVDGTTAPLVTVPTPATQPATPSTETATDSTATDPTATDPEPINSESATTTTTTSDVAATTGTADLVPSRPVRILLIGDSTALATGTGLSAWAASHPDLAAVEVRGVEGCGLTSDDERLLTNQWLGFAQGCQDVFETEIPQRVRDGRPDIVVVLNSFWEVTDHRAGPDAEPTSIADPAFRAAMLAHYEEYTQKLLDAGAPRVAWVLYPETDYVWDDLDEHADDSTRYALYYQLQRDAAAAFPDTARVIDFAAWADAEGLTLDRGARPDGVHWTADASTRIAEQWLGNAIVQAALR